MLVRDEDYFDDFGQSEAEILTARSAASRMLREAINTRYICPDTLADFPTPAGDELEELVATHGRALAAYMLSYGHGGVSTKIAAERATAIQWIKSVKAGEVSFAGIFDPRPASNAGYTAAPAIQVVGRHKPGFDLGVLTCGGYPE